MGDGAGCQWGVWVQVSEDDFHRYLELWEKDGVEEEPPLRGWLSGGVPAYPGSCGLEVSVHLHSDNQRPLFRVVSDRHPLGVDQRRGITMEKVHSFLEPFVRVGEAES